MFSKDCLFEVSWEVCNKVGGINTVITSKASFVSSYFSNYYLIGPYFKSSEKECLMEDVPFEFIGAYEELLKLGIVVHFGTWLIKGNPKVILVEHIGYSKFINEIKAKLWEHFKIDSLNSAWYDFDEAILWSFVCGIVIEKLSFKFERVFIHAHEWMSGGAIFYNKIANNLKARTVFTTHATMLGRSICGSGEDLYKEENSNIDFDKKAYELGVHTKHQCEKALAKIADTFTTVSDITAFEAEKFYLKKCDILLYNGFDNTYISDIENIKKEYFKSREKNIEFIKSYFHDFYDLDVKNSSLLFTSGRNEFRNKGDDLLILALGKLNEKLKEKNSSKNVISFFLVPVGNFEKDNEVKNSFENKQNGNERKIGKSFAPLSTHKIPFENPLIKTCFENKLFNSKEDNVKVIIVPVYINGTEDFFNRNYYDVIRGFDIGIFASFYEPWGYTPLESISYAVPTVTSDLAGFGRYFKLNFGEKNSVKVLERENKNFNETAEDLAIYLENFLKLENLDFFNLKLEAKDIAFRFDWKFFIKNYIYAYEFADRKKR